MITLNSKHKGIVILNTSPDICPYCHKTIEPVYVVDNMSAHSYEVIFKCPNRDCERVLIGRYTQFGLDSFNFVSCNIGTLIKKEFSDEINGISPAFIKIYNEAYFAEQHQLYEICGLGYRKALEFLIKDYLIAKTKQNPENIKKKFLGDCIKDDIASPNIKKAVERAAWLGNDETHYVKTWENKNLQDLKKLLELTIHWIDMEEITSSLDEDMPSKKQIKT